MRRWLANIFLKISDKLCSERVEDRKRRSNRLTILERMYSDLCDAHNKLVFQQLDERWRFVELPEWTSDDAIAWETFLRSDTGRALRARMQAIAATCCIAGCENTINTTHSAGIGAGWKECVDKLLEHTKISRAAGVQAAKADEAPEGVEQLIERLSP